MDVFREEESFNVFSPLSTCFWKKKSPENHDPNSVWQTVLPPGEISLPDIQLHASSRGCRQRVKRTIVHDRTAAPIFSFQARSSGERSVGRNIPLFWFIALQQPHHCSAEHSHSARGSRGVLHTCLLSPQLSTALHSASPDKQLRKATRESLLATSVQLWAHLSTLIKCLIFIHASFHSDKHQEQPNYVFLTPQLVFINLICTYLHITP